MQPNLFCSYIKNKPSASRFCFNCYCSLLHDILVQTLPKLIKNYTRPWIVGLLGIEAPTIDVQSATNCDSRLLFQPFLSEFPALFSINITEKCCKLYIYTHTYVFVCVFINGDLPHLEYPGPVLIKQKLTVQFHLLVALGKCLIRFTQCHSTKCC